MDGEADIDPEKPAVDLQAQQQAKEQELLTKSAAITDAFDQEQLFELSADIIKFNELFKKYRNAYILRLASLSIFCLGMIFLMLSFSLYFSDNLNARKEYETCIKDNKWSTWKYTADKNHLQKERCKSILYTTKDCPNSCVIDYQKNYLSEKPSTDDDDELKNFAVCTNDNGNNSSTIYVRHKISSS